MAKQMDKRIPGLLLTESAADFVRLHEELKNQIAPKGPLEEHYVEDLAYIIWEIRRFRRIRAELLNLALPEALGNLLEEVMDYGKFETMKDGDEAAENLARRWPTEERVQAKVLKLLRDANLDEAAIEAEGFRSCSEDFERIDRLLASSMVRRDKHLYFMAEGRDSLFKHLQAVSDTIVEHEAPRLLASVS